MGKRHNHLTEYDFKKAGYIIYECYSHNKNRAKKKTWIKKIARRKSVVIFSKGHIISTKSAAHKGRGGAIQQRGKQVLVKQLDIGFWAVNQRSIIRTAGDNLLKV